MDALEDAYSQDIWDRVGFYSTGEERSRKEEDARGGLPCSNSVAYRAKDTSLLKNCPFENRLYKNRGAVRCTEVQNPTKDDNIKYLF